MLIARIIDRRLGLSNKWSYDKLKLFSKDVGEEGE